MNFNNDISVSLIKRPYNLKCEYSNSPLGLETLLPRFSWWLDSDMRNKSQKGYQILVSSSLDKLERHIGDKWDTGKVIKESNIHVQYAGKPLNSGEKCFWKVRVWDENDNVTPYSATASFEMGLLEEEDWMGKWIGRNKSDGPCPLFRKSFVLDKSVRAARAYICGLGYYEFYLNGKKVGDHVLDPNWTDYDQRELQDLLYPFDDKTGKHVMYVTYDITEQIKKGQNTLGAMLGNGWYNQRERQEEGKLWYGHPRMILQLNVEYDDGSFERIVTDGTWKTSYGPIVFNNIFHGEIYDARLEQDQWTENGFDDSSWEYAEIMEKPKGKLTSQMSPPDKVIQTLEPVRLTNPSQGIYIFDFGQNFTGWVKLRVEGPKGFKVCMRMAEELEEDGTLNTATSGWGKQDQRETYILKGSGVETYEPRFTWYGFRYVELIGYPGEPGLDSIQGKVVHSDVARIGHFECSNSLFNQIQKNYIWSQLTNMHGGVPSDCPHRERLGYTGDGQVTAEAAVYNLDMASFYTKWLNDIRDAQNKETGFVPHTAPFGGGGGGPGWGSACILIPWTMYKYYGDIRILEDHYPAMKHWMEYLSTRTDDSNIIVREEPGGWCLGDWSTPGKVKIPETLVNTFFYGFTAGILSRIAQVLGIEQDVEFYSHMEKNVKISFNDKFLNKEEGYYSIGCQGADVFPLAWGVVPEEYKNEVVNHLINNIMVNNNGYLDTGIFATPLMLDVLVDQGYTSTAYTILNQTEYPSYGYMVAEGATTLWENWEKGSSADEHCPSHNHPMFGSVSAWFYRKIAGIEVDPEEPGFERIIIKPHHMGDLTYANAHLCTVRGLVSSSWKLSEDMFIMEIVIPVGSKARVYVPKLNHRDICVMEGEYTVWAEQQYASGIEGIMAASEDEGYVILEVGSGSYTFRVMNKEGSLI